MVVTARDEDDGNRSFDNVQILGEISSWIDDWNNTEDHDVDFNVVMVDWAKNIIEELNGNPKFAEFQTYVEGWLADEAKDEHDVEYKIFLKDSAKDLFEDILSEIGKPNE